MPLVGVMGQTEWKRCCSESGQIGIVLKCRGLRIGTWPGCLEMSHGDDTSRGRGHRACLLEEHRRENIAKNWLDRLRKLGRLNGRDKTCCTEGYHKQVA